MKYKYFVYLLCISIFIIIAIYILIYFTQIKLLTPSEKWIHDIYVFKKERSTNIQKNRIVFLSGSNSLFSINTKIIQEKTSHNVINLGLHAGLDISFLYYVLKENIKENDIVIMPLEFEHYKRENPYNDWFIENMLNWGKKIYLNNLNIIDLTKFIIHTPFELVLKRFFILLFDKNDLNLLTSAEINLFLAEIWQKSGENTWNKYSYKSLNKEGDMNIKDSLNLEQIDYLEPRLNEKLQISSHFLNYYIRIEELVKSKKAKLYLTYPILLENNKFDLDNLEVKKNITYFQNQLNINGLKMLCEAYTLNKENFLNGNYHANYNGSVKFSKHLSECIIENILLEKR